MSTRKESEDKLINRATRDPRFRATLIADPHAAVADELGTAPDGVTITVLEETPQQIYIVLPATPTTDGALSDDELTTVAGGAEHPHHHKTHGSPLDPRGCDMHS